MRFPIASTVAATFIAGTYVGLQAASQQCQPAERAAALYEPIDVPTFSERQSDTFHIESAEWDPASRSLIVNTRMFHEKGTLLTMMGLPESTWVDAFRITSDYTGDFEVTIPEGHPVPCLVEIRTAFEQKVVSIDNAPDVCDNLDAIMSRRKARSKSWGRELFGRDLDRVSLASVEHVPARY